MECAHSSLGPARLRGSLQPRWPPGYNPLMNNPVVLVCVAVASAAFVGACSNDVVVTAESHDEASTSAVGGATSGGSSGAGGASSTSTTGSSSGSSGSLALRVNTPDTDPGQWRYITSTLSSGDPPAILAQGPFMLKKVKGYLVFLVTGTDCSGDPYATLEHVGSGDYNIPVLPGQSLCLRWDSSAGQPIQVTWISGYAPYP